MYVGVYLLLFVCGSAGLAPPLVKALLDTNNRPGLILDRCVCVCVCVVYRVLMCVVCLCVVSILDRCVMSVRVC